MPDLWKSLRVGDSIQIVCMPTEFSRPSYFLHEETRDFYERLIAQKATLKVVEVDDLGLPWIEYTSVNQGGEPYEWHWLAVNHSGLSLVGIEAE